MVRKNKKYYWRNRKEHLAETNVRKVIRHNLEHSILMGSNSINMFEKFTPLSLQPQWPEDVVTRFEREAPYDQLEYFNKSEVK